ncbi:hypothetical protein B0H11DRAFT_2426072 [Mycena galericulata]|nr:hypothetical protein B0H11DRAFT_373442 [Mycena galericulata]KAJ7477312.1 hypothetical protein B0H11DRAFT_2426072 [Mycena galericulata]
MSESGTTPTDPAKLGEQFILFTGPLLVGLIIDWMLQGTLIVQLYLYYIANRKDPILLKVVVYGVFVLDTIQTVFATAETWDMLVVNWGNTGIVAHPFWAGGVLPMMSGLISFCVQSFFAWRIYTLKQTRFILCISAVIVAVSFVQVVASIIESAQFVANTTDLARIYPKHYIWLSGTLVADVMITASMVGVLWGVKSSTHFESTDRMIMRLIVLSIEVGALTTIVAGAELAISKLFPQYFLYEVPAFILGKLSNNSLLVSLNARGYVRGNLNTTIGRGESTAIGLNSTIRLRAPSDFTETQTGSQSGIHITKDVVHDSDYFDRKATQTV